jgi:predicted DNA-binding transcriptional regulator YafY
MDRVQSKAARLRRIEHKLYNTPAGMRAVDIAAYCGVDRRTIYRDLESLAEMGVPIWEGNGRFGIDRDTYLSTVRLNLNETVALYFAARLIAHHSDEHNPYVAATLDKLATAMPDGMIAGHLARSAADIRSRPLRKSYVRALELLTRAWADRRRIRISYQATGAAPSERVIEPYFLEVSRSEPAAYVLAHDSLRQAIRTFKIERISEAELLDETYELPEDFDPYAYLAPAWGIMPEETEVDVVLRFSPVVTGRVKESVWHRSQQLRDLEGGGCEVRLRVGGTREIRQWILSWGGDVEVLAPEELRADLAEHARRMLGLYGG